MKRLFVTNDSSASGNLGVSRHPDFLISLSRQLVWGQFPSDAELSGFFGKRKKRQSRLNWQDHQPQHRLERIDAVALDWSSCVRGSMLLNYGWIRVRTINCN